MTQLLKLIYGHDTLCGWCFGFIPVLDHFTKIYPYIQIDVVPGGLVVGPKVQSYAMMVDYIAAAEPNLTRVTGRTLGEAFHSLISGQNSPLSISAPPSHAILQIDKLVPERTLEFAHLLQEAHFGEGKDVNLVETYTEICETHGFPALDTEAVVAATENDPLVAESYDRSASLGIRSFPTVLVADAQDKVIDSIQSIYEPAEFVVRFEAIAAIAAA